jgi:isochorismatase family protein
METVDQIRISPRYYRWHVDEGVEWVETHTAHAQLDWAIPLNRAALVLVDVWDGHYLADTAARAERIVQENVTPLLRICRAAGMLLIHAPSPEQARSEPGYVGEDPAALPASAAAEVWPPETFGSKTGPHAAFSRPTEPRQGEIDRCRAQRCIHPLAAPRSGEPVVATGAQLHRVCAERGILFLFYLGFNTNACILLRDYGTLAMGRRGYEVIILRDCTTGMEAASTQPELGQTRSTILFLEMFGHYSCTGAELQAALQV